MGVPPPFQHPQSSPPTPTSFVKMPVVLSISAIRSVEKAGTDDVLLVTRTREGKFVLKYKNRSESITHVVSMDDWASALRHIETSLTLMAADREPFVAVQVTLPAHPAVILRTEDLQDSATRAAVLRGVRDTLRNWPLRPQDDPLSE